MTTEHLSYARKLGKQGQMAAQALTMADTETKDKVLLAACDYLKHDADKIVAANEKDLAMAREMGKNDAFIDRLMLDHDRIDGMADGVAQIAKLMDPVGRTLARFDRPNGLVIERTSVPLGVIAMIYESRPNVGADASALCIKSGNAIILRGGKESLHSSSVIIDCFHKALEENGLPKECVQMVDTPDREVVRHLLACSDYIDMVIPRGGKGLVQLVKDHAKVPTLLHLDGNCHTYIHEKADLTKAVDVVNNAKLRRTGICGATESLVIDRAIASQVLPKLLDKMVTCEFRGCEVAQKIDDRIVAANEEDFATEYLDSCLSVKIVENSAEALSFIDQHSSHHTDAIITEDDLVAKNFLRQVDSAVVMHNTSTQFSDGGEFGMGAEIGIATGKIHARGPVGLEQLNTFKYQVMGSGQVRA